MINISTYIIIYIPVNHRLFISDLYTSFMYICFYLHTGSKVTQPEALKTSFYTNLQAVVSFIISLKHYMGTGLLHRLQCLTLSQKPLGTKSFRLYVQHLESF